MVFSSPVFLFLFLPLVLGLYFLSPKPVRNLLLLTASLLFYSWGTKLLVLMMLASISANWLLGLWVGRVRETRWGKAALAITVALNLAPLVYFKYTNFLAGNLGDLLAPFGIALPALAPIVLPIGISFFTFHEMSYVIDVYRGEAAVERNPINVALYVAFFPQSIAGPIVRYVDVAAQIRDRRVTVDGFAEGIERFLLGLVKKLLIANSVAPVADAIFELPDNELTFALAWLGVICYSLQIYFDFSGYSDMAIGLGLMFGFRFMENFNYPYIARSVTEFWRRWHISLSTWFRDYLYIPLGGNQRGTIRTYFNLLLVFFLCGLWHGASWKFVAWGLFHGAFLVIERRGLGKWLGRRWSPLAHLYTLLAVMVGWVFFRAVNLQHAIAVLLALCGIAQGDGVRYHPGLYLDTGLWLVLILGCLASTPCVPWFKSQLAGLRDRCSQQPWLAGPLEAGLGLGRVTALAACLLASAILLSASTYNPFIYFQF